MKLALGTVQFGLAYGIANTAGQVPRDEVARILDRAHDAGVDTLDTAAAYGDAERTLGELGINGWRIVTKVPPLPEGTDDPRRWVRRTIEQSLKNLGRRSVDAVLLHRVDDLGGPCGAAIWTGLEAAKSAGLCARIGVSIYGPDVLDALPEGIRPDLVQAPFNVFDRRLETSSWAERLSDQGTAIHIRSSFLQGLLLMPTAARAERFHREFPQLKLWDAFLAQTSAQPAAAALNFALSRPWAERVVVGVDTERQLADLLAAAGYPQIDLPDGLASDDPRLIDPSQWNRT